MYVSLFVGLLAHAALVNGNCDTTIPGFWYCVTCNPQEECVGSWNSSAGLGAFSFTSDSQLGWQSMYGQLEPGNLTATAVFSDGQKVTGNVSVDCTSISWPAKLGTWEVYTPPYEYYNVHLCPHTHDDVGWDETYLQYYYGNGLLLGRNVSKIISQVVAGLLEDPRRKFSYVEQAYFQIWFETQTATLQDSVRSLVASGQLQFLNGGWSMHDEANPTFVDMLDNTAVGQRNILNNFGPSAVPQTTWQIDPFGHSGFQGVLSSSIGGFNGVIWGREPADFKALSGIDNGLERVWTPSPSLGGAAATLQAIFVDGGYSTPGEAGRCDRIPGFDLVCSYDGAYLDINAIKADIIFSRGPRVRGNNVLFQLGTDFTWENAINGTLFGEYFRYVDGIRDLLNADPKKRFRAFYSTPAEYVKAKLSNVTSLPLVVSDMFPYNDDTVGNNENGHNIWAGYFTSRPAFKGFVRESSAYMQAARQLQAITGSASNGLGPDNKLFAMERAMGVVQHHDSISGTAKQRVNNDYEKTLEGGRQDTYSSIASDIASATGYNSSTGWSLCPLSNVTLCIALETAQPTVAALYNSLGQAASAAPMRLPVGMPSGVTSWAVQDGSGSHVVAQLVPLSPRDQALRTLYNGSTAIIQWLCFVSNLPPAGFAVYFLTPVASADDAPLTFTSHVSSGVSPSITNGRLTLNISSETGFMSALEDSQTGLVLPLAQSWLSYVGFNGLTELNGSKQASGAYIFRPTHAPPALLAEGAATTTLVTGPIVNESWADYAYVTQSTRLWTGASSIEVEWTVGPVNVSDFQSHEVITRYESAGFSSGGAWVTDANCRESESRLRNARTNWTVTLNEPVSGNYYPVNCLIRTTSTGIATLAVAVDRSEGGTSLTDGTLELMVHRRLLFDDHRGVNQPLDEPGVDGKGLIIRGRHWIVAAPPATAAGTYKAVHVQALSLPTTVVALSALDGLSPAQWASKYAVAASALSAPLPPNLHLTTLHVHNASLLLLRLSHLYEVGEDPVLSGNVTVNVASMLALPGGRKVTAAVDMTLPGTIALANVPKQTYVTDGGATYTVPVLPDPPAGSGLSVTLAPMQIRTLMCTVS